MRALKGWDSAKQLILPLKRYQVLHITISEAPVISFWNASVPMFYNTLLIHLKHQSDNSHESLYTTECLALCYTKHNFDHLIFFSKKISESYTATNVSNIDIGFYWQLNLYVSSFLNQLDVSGAIKMTNVFVNLPTITFHAYKIY